MKFKLESQFKPTGDQPKAIKKLINGLKKDYRDQTLLGVTGSGKTFTMANIIEKVQKPTLVIAHNKTLAAQLASEFREFFPNNAVHYFVSYYDYYQPEAYIPRSDTYIEKETSINDEIDRLRHAATYSLLNRKDVIIVASVSCIYGLGEPEDYIRESFSIKKGDKIRREEVIRRLIDIQYKRNDVELSRGNFRVRGDTLEIVPIYGEEVTRIGFFGNNIESLEKLDNITGNILEKLDNIVIPPAKHFMTRGETFKKALVSIRSEMEKQKNKFKKEGKLIEAQRIEQRTNYDLEMMGEIGYTSGIENYSRHMYQRKAGSPPSTLIDFFGKDFLMFIDESHMTVPQIGGMYNGDQARKDNLIIHGFRLPSARDNRPLKFEEFDKKINNVVYVSATPASYELEKSKIIAEQIIRPTGLLDPMIEVKPSENQVDDLIEQIRERVARGQRVLITTITKKLAERLASYLEELDIKVAYLHSDINTLKRIDIIQSLREGIYDCLVGINLLREGLDLPEVSLVAILDADKEGFLRSGPALIQIMGRAARHIDGKVIMYADNVTRSMKMAMDETGRRRKIQEKYNKDHGIKPRSIKKAIRLSDWKEKDTKKKKDALAEDIGEIPKGEARRIIKILERKMDIASKNLEFEKAAELRDDIERLKRVK